MKALVLAAGRGERLRPLTGNIAKPALTFFNFPIVGHVLSHLKTQGVDEAVVNVHHCPSSIRKAVLASQRQVGEDNFPHIGFSVETELLGTGGGLKFVWEMFKDEELFLLVNGDCIREFPLQEALARHRESKAMVTLLTVSDRKEHSPVISDETGRVKGFGRDKVADTLRPETFTGIHILDSRVARYFPEKDSFDMVRDVYFRMLESGERIMTVPCEGFWSDLGTAERYRESIRSYSLWKGIKLPFVTEGARCDKTANLLGACVVEEDAVIESKAQLTDSIVMAGARVGEGAVLDDCIVGPGANVKPGETHSDAVLV